jgi:hypothetical protein
MVRTIVFAAVLSSALASSEVNHLVGATGTNLAGAIESNVVGLADSHVMGSEDIEVVVDAMKEVFARSDEMHQKSMAGIMSNMSIVKALEVLGKANINSTDVKQIGNLVMGKHSNLRKQPTGYSGLAGARKMLNDMIYESLSKYDNEIAKCTEYYSKQCAAMEVCRGQIAASNYIAANSRALILDSQATINKCEVDIPTRKLELKQHLLKCKHELFNEHASQDRDG